MSQMLQIEFSDLFSIRRKLCKNALNTTELILNNTENKSISISLKTRENQCKSNIKYSNVKFSTTKFKWYLASFDTEYLPRRGKKKKKEGKKLGHSS